MRMRRMWILFGMDVLIIWTSIYAAYFLRFYGMIPAVYLRQGLLLMLITTAVSAIVMYGFKLYRRMWQYASVGEMILLFQVITMSMVISFLMTDLFSGSFVPLSVMMLSYETTLLLMIGTRFAWRIYRNYQRKSNTNKRHALIIGAGDCGMRIAKELLYNPASQMYPVAFIDDDPAKQQLQTYGIPIVGNRDSIAYAVEKYQVEDIVIAIPSASKSDIARMIAHCKQHTKAKLQMIPRLGDLIAGKVSINTIRKVEVEDLLGREPVTTDLHGIADYVANKIVLVTGAGGSIGSELCRQIAPFKPSKLLLLGHGENSAFFTMSFSYL